MNAKRYAPVEYAYFRHIESYFKYAL